MQAALRSYSTSITIIFTASTIRSAIAPSALTLKCTEWTLCMLMNIQSGNVLSQREVVMTNVENDSDDDTSIAIANVAYNTTFLDHSRCMVQPCIARLREEATSSSLEQAVDRATTRPLSIFHTVQRTAKHGWKFISTWTIWCLRTSCLACSG